MKMSNTNVSTQGRQATQRQTRNSPRKQIFNKLYTDLCNTKDKVSKAKYNLEMYQINHARKISDYKDTRVPNRELCKILTKYITFIDYISKRQHHLAFYHEHRYVTDQAGHKAINPSYQTYDLLQHDLERLIHKVYPDFANSHFRDLVEDIQNQSRKYYDSAKSPMQRYIPLANGAWDKRKHTLVPYNKELVFFAKIQTAYNPDAAKPVVVHGWSFENWLKTILLPQQQHLALKVLYDGIDGTQCRSKLAFLYGPPRAGKSMFGDILTALINGMTGHNVSTIRMTHFNKPFALAPLSYVIANVGDNVQSNVHITDDDILHSQITGNSIPINQKNEPAWSMNWHGLNMQSSNGLPSFSDKQGMARRMLILKFQHQFDGTKPQIGSDYIYRKDVREHILWLVLNHVRNFNHYTKAECVTDNPAFDEWLDKADPVDEFVDKYLTKIIVTYKLTRIPTIILRAVYMDWAKHHGYSYHISTRTFGEHIAPMIKRIGWGKKVCRVNKATCSKLNSWFVEATSLKITESPETATCYIQVTPHNIVTDKVQSKTDVQRLDDLSNDRGNAITDKIRHYTMDNGLSNSEATKQVKYDLANDFAKDFAPAAISQYLKDNHVTKANVRKITEKYMNKYHINNVTNAANFALADRIVTNAMFMCPKNYGGDDDLDNIMKIDKSSIKEKDNKRNNNTGKSSISGIPDDDMPF